MHFFFFKALDEFNGGGTCKAETNARAIEHCNKDIRTLSLGRRIQSKQTNKKKQRKTKQKK